MLLLEQLQVHATCACPNTTPCPAPAPAPRQVDLAEVLRSSRPLSSSSINSSWRSSARLAGGLTPATAPSSLRSSLEGVEEALPASFASTQRGSPPLSGEHAQQTQHPQPPAVWGISATVGSQTAQVSPFAEAAAAAAASGAMSPVPPAGALSPSGGMRLSPSRGGSVASAVLRQVGVASGRERCCTASWSLCFHLPVAASGQPCAPVLAPAMPAHSCSVTVPQASLQSALSRMLTEQEASPVSPHEWEGELGRQGWADTASRKPACVGNASDAALPAAAPSSIQPC